MSSPTTSASASPSATGGGGGGGSGPTSSPLLFFVALGFGVVFTNLWIIVGVKYCFRYNQRNRAARAAADGEPIDLAAMPRPHRRRREKKLMSMDEVNERFPLTKYKQWKASRENEGLPTAGGITTAPPSRAASLKDVEAVVTPLGDDGSSTHRPGTALSMAQEDQATANKSSLEQPKSPKSPKAVEQALEKKDEKDEKDEKHVELARVETAATSHYQPNKEPAQAHAHDGDESDDDDPIRTAAAPEMLADPGDTCAICIDTLEDDDDVRGLTCGHAFHASCVDPWLTSRRACCPLCKADYYVPKPRPEGEAADQSTSGRRPTGLRSPTSPQASWAGGRVNPFLRSRVVLMAGPNGAPNNRNNEAHLLAQTQRTFFSTPARRNRTAAPERPGESLGWRSRIRGSGSRPNNGSFSNWFGRNRNNGNAGNNDQPTPAQLEAGNR